MLLNVFVQGCADGGCLLQHREEADRKLTTSADEEGVEEHFWHAKCGMNARDISRICFGSETFFFARVTY